MIVQGRRDRRSLAAWLQNLVFLPGPGSGNLLATKEDDARRRAQLQRLIVPGCPESAAWFAAIEQVYGGPIHCIGVDVVAGGSRRIAMPVISIDMMGTWFGDPTNNKSRVNETRPHHAEALCRHLIEALDAEWVDAVYVGNFHGFRVECGATHDVTG